MKQMKSEQVLKFEQQTKGTIFTVLKIVGVIPLILMFIGMFLPICDVLTKDISIFEFTDGSTAGFLGIFLIYLVGICPSMIVDLIRNKTLEGKIEKSNASLLVLVISIIVVIVEIVFAIINLPVSMVANSLEVSKEIFNTGIGTSLVFIGSIMYSVLSLIESWLYSAVFKDKIDLDKLPKIINITNNTAKDNIDKSVEDKENK